MKQKILQKIIYTIIWTNKKKLDEKWEKSIKNNEDEYWQDKIEKIVEIKK